MVAKVSITKDTGSSCTFYISEVTSAFVNGLRRVAIGELPTYAIDSVDMLKNTSSFSNEYISHRLGFIRLNTPYSKTPKEIIEMRISAEATLEGERQVTPHDLMKQSQAHEDV
jgi:DNA-directed RNA polymerase alpha subunit